MSPAATWLRAACRPVRGTRNGDDSPSDERQNVLCRVERRRRRPVILQLDFGEGFYRRDIATDSGTNRKTKRRQRAKVIITHIFFRVIHASSHVATLQCVHVCVCVCVYICAPAHDSPDPSVVNKLTFICRCVVLSSSPLAVAFRRNVVFFFSSWNYKKSTIRELRFYVYMSWSTIYENWQ